jgi:hypothetical protein
MDKTPAPPEFLVTVSLPMETMVEFSEDAVRSLESEVQRHASWVVFEAAKVKKDRKEDCVSAWDVERVADRRRESASDPSNDVVGKLGGGLLGNSVTVWANMLIDASFSALSVSLSLSTGIVGTFLMLGPRILRRWSIKRFSGRPRRNESA